ncbi:hypothetical protein [Nocardioides sp.]|uniref:hypothetical protein n=1 Tax=Nocardioides sp. TaxID=35761 RepID=UPI003D147A0F
MTDSSGAAALVRYSEFDTVENGLAHYNTKLGGVSDRNAISVNGEVVRYAWLYQLRSGRGLYTLSSMFTRYPFSLSVEAVTPGGRRWVLRNLVTIRPERDILGVRSSGASS